LLGCENTRGQREAAPFSILNKSPIPKSLRSKSFQNAKIKVQNDRAKVKNFDPMESGSCHFDFCHLIFEFWSGFGAWDLRFLQIKN
jgi:hypothetical protein